MTMLRVLCPVCQSGPLDPPKACEFCPESVVTGLDDVDRSIARLTAGPGVTPSSGPALRVAART